MSNFTPITAALGGLLIGFSAVILMGLNGRIAGISGIFSGIIYEEATEKLWRVLFVLGLVIAPLIVTYLTGKQATFEITSNWLIIVVGGLLVGFGTRLGSGCTSGHGVCGLARFSVRSLIAVVIFISAGVATVAVVRTFLGV